MNERIKQLATQATRQYSPTYYTQEWIQGFAQLIVTECIDIASREDFDVMMKEGYPCSQTAKKIREHFGVEE